MSTKSQSMTYPELEAENARLRADLAELREMFVTTTMKLGTIAGIIGFSADVPLQEMIEGARAKLGEVPGVNQRTVERAARWLENHDIEVLTSGNEFSRETMKQKTPTTWTGFQYKATAMLNSIRPQ